MTNGTTMNFDWNQKLFVFINDEDMPYIPCVPFDKGCFVTRIPHMAWIRYRGLAKVHNTTFMRCMYEEEEVYISPVWLSHIEDIDYRKPGMKMMPVPKTRILPAKKETRFRQMKINVSSGNKPKKPKKKKVQRRRR